MLAMSPRAVGGSWDRAVMGLWFSQLRYPKAMLCCFRLSVPPSLPPSAAFQQTLSCWLAPCLHDWLPALPCLQSLGEQGLRWLGELAWLLWSPYPLGLHLPCHQPFIEGSGNQLVDGLS